MADRYISPSTIEDLAKHIRSDAGLNDTEPGAVDVIRLANFLNCRVQTVDFTPDSISAKIERLDGNGCLIQISNSDGPKRQRFSIAHEVSHYILHDDKEFVEYRKPLADYDNASLLYKEVQANMLASALLMPRDLVIKAWEKTRDLDDLAEIFNVSRSTVYYRLDNLGLLNSD